MKYACAGTTYLWVSSNLPPPPIPLSVRRFYWYTCSPKMPTGLSWLILVFTLWLCALLWGTVEYCGVLWGALHSCRTLRVVKEVLFMPHAQSHSRIQIHIPRPLPSPLSRPSRLVEPHYASFALEWLEVKAGRLEQLVVYPTPTPLQHVPHSARCSQCLLLGVATARVILSFFIFYFVHNLRVYLPASVCVSVCVGVCVCVSVSHCVCAIFTTF